MKRNRWQQIDQARMLLGVPEEVTRLEIQEAYRRRCREIHPDHQPGEGEAAMADLNAAYRLLMEYSDHYRLKLRPTEESMTDEEWWMYHFGQDPVWGRDRED